MGIARNEKQMTWGGTFSTSATTAAATKTSDAVTIDATATQGRVQVKADNSGTPASGDTLTVKILYSLGDPDGTSTDEYETASSVAARAVIDTNASGNDPGLVTFPIDICAKSFKVHVVNNATGANTIVASCTYMEKTAT